MAAALAAAAAVTVAVAKVVVVTLLSPTKDSSISKDNLPFKFRGVRVKMQQVMQQREHQ